MTTENRNTCNRRQFIGYAGSTLLLLLAKNSWAADGITNGSGEFLFLEAEAFDYLGGWVVDQQSMDQMGSPYLLAHGLGIPVVDATTNVRFPSPGSYRVWVRTRDWVAPWQVPGAPGKFQVLINGHPLQEIFGTKSADWHWHDGGLLTVTETAVVSLHDLTGFEGRCDAILFSKNPTFEPSNNLDVLTGFRRRLLGLSNQPVEVGSFDLVVVGGGIAGTCAALSAARQGLKVGLVQDRPVLGGNGSAEVRVWPEGKTNLEPFPHLGDIVDEIVPAGHHGNGKNGSFYGDEQRLKVVRTEPGIKLFLEHRVIQVEANNGSLVAVVAESIRTGVRIRLVGTLFADCTGDATVGFRGGADYEVTPKNHQGMSNLWNVMDVANKDQVLHCECKDKTALCTAYEIGNTAQPFPRCPWAIDLTDKPFPGRKDYKGQWGGKPLDNLGAWFWESGFDMIR